MEQAVQQIISGDAAAAEAGNAAVLAALRGQKLNVVGLVALLQGPLTDEQDHDGRARAVQLLSQVVSDAPECLQEGDAAVMADFLSAKLQDWRCVSAAAPGCLALLQRHHHQHLAPLAAAAAQQLITRFMTVHVQGLVYKGRLTCYQLLLEVLHGPFGVSSVLNGSNFVDFTVVSMENEADPRCLMVALQCVQAVGKLYQHPDLSNITHLDDGLEDLFDVGVVPYFPMMFTPPKNDPNKISRDELLCHVVSAMAACPQFAALGVPLLSEKLGSTLKQAKSDSLLALPVCVRGWGAAAVRPHLQAVWLMLKAELMAPATADGISTEQLAAKHAAATAAAAALTQCTSALGPGSLDQRVLSDVAVDDLMQYLGLVNPPWSQNGNGLATGPGVTSSAAAAAAGWDLPEKAQKRLVCIARVVAAVAVAGGASCTATCTEVLQPAVAAVLDDATAAASSSSSSDRRVSRPMQANCGVLCVLHCALRAVAAAVTPSPAAAAADDDDEISSYAALASVIPDIADALVALQLALQQQAGSSSGSNVVHHDSQQAEQLQIWILLTWQDLVSLPLKLAPLRQQQLHTAAQQLVHLALHSSSSSSSSSTVRLELDLEGNSSYSLASAAAAALTALAAWPSSAVSADSSNAASGMQAVKQHAAPVLLGLLNSSSSSSGDDQSSSALGLLQQVAGSSAAAAWEVLTWLRPLVLQQLQTGDMVTPCVSLQHQTDLLVLQDALCQLLPTLHSYCVPVLADDLDQQQSAAAAAFANDVLQAWQQQQQQRLGDSEAADRPQYHSSLLLAQLVAKCSSKDQQLLMLTACDWVMTAAAAAAGDDDGVSNRDANFSSAACLAAAVVAAARPGVLVANSVVDLASALTTICIAANGSSSSSHRRLDKLLSGVALASVIHKCSTHQRASPIGSESITPDAVVAAVLPKLLEVVQVRLLQQQQRQQQQCSGAPGRLDAVGALHALAWVSRALAMQRHDSWHQCMQQVLLLLPLLATSPGDSEVLWAAAEYFAVLIASPLLQAAGGSNRAAVAFAQQQQEAGVAADLLASSATLGLRCSMHWAPRPLWQQKVFTLVLSAASEAIGSNSVGEQQQQSLGLRLAVAHLLSAAPAAVSSTEHAQVVPLLLQTLAQLSTAAPAMLAAASASTEAEAAAGKLLHLLHDCLLMLAGVLMSAADQPVQGLLTPHVEQLLNMLCQLARLTLPAAVAGGTAATIPQQNMAMLIHTAAAVRELALMSLTSVMGVPYHMLHPYRRQVLAVVTAALDDDRRAVRKAAVICRSSWTIS